MRKSTLVVGIGGGGINITNDFIKRNRVYADFYVIDNDDVSIKNSLADYKTYIKQNYEKKRNTEQIFLDYKKFSYEIKLKIKQYKRIYIISCLGGLFSSTVTPDIIKIVLEEQKEHKIVLIKPFKTLTDNILKRTEKCLNEISQMNINTYILSNEAFKIVSNKSMTVNEFYKVYNDEIEKIFSNNNAKSNIFSQSFLNKCLGLE